MQERNTILNKNRGRGFFSLLPEDGGACRQLLIQPGEHVIQQLSMFMLWTEQNNLDVFLSLHRVFPAGSKTGRLLLPPSAPASSRIRRRCGAAGIAADQRRERSKQLAFVTRIPLQYRNFHILTVKDGCTGSSRSPQVQCSIKLNEIEFGQKSCLA
jgi:hypothetical protein